MLSIYLVIGAVAGLMAGLFGIGGGVVVIPALTAIFSHSVDISQDYVMQVAVGTSLATMIVTSSSSLYAHYKRGAVRWEYWKQMTPGLIVGVILGAIAANFLPSKWLQIVFALFLLVVGLRMAINKTAKPVATHVVAVRTMQWASVVIGGLSSILGVGGGTLIVPFLLRCQMDMREATATSVACGLVIGIVATACFMVTGLFASVHMPWSTGYIFWPALIGIGITSILFAPMGASLAHKLPRDLLKQIFGAFLLLMSIDMLFFK
jgi:uncharacterized membrane protein YfcA